MGQYSVTINNSFCNFSQNTPKYVIDSVRALLTYQNDIAAKKAMIFSRMRYFKQNKLMQKYHAAKTELKQLEDSEFVCWLDGLRFPTGHLNIVLDLLKALKEEPVLDDQRAIPDWDFNIRWNNKPWDPRYYQSEMIKLGKLHHRGVFESAVGTGKTLVMTYLIKEIPVNSLIIVPSRGLMGQLYEDLIVYFGINKVQKISTDKIRNQDRLKPIRITTIQTMASLQKTGELHHLIQDVKSLYIDEIHHAGSVSYTNLLPDIDHIYYRFGFTGTFLRNDSKTLDMWGFLSTKLYSYPAYKAIEEGYLTPIDVTIYNLPGNRKMNYAKEYNENYCDNPVLLDKIHDIVHKNYQQNQILILVKRKAKSGKIIHEYLKQLGYQNTYISGDDSVETINNSISDFNDKKINVLIGSSVIGEGIDIRSSDHLIMAQGEKSEITIVQALGRLARLFDGKEIGYLHDFNFQKTKYMVKHTNMRLDIYKNNFSPKNIRRL